MKKRNVIKVDFRSIQPEAPAESSSLLGETESSVEPSSILGDLDAEARFAAQYPDNARVPRFSLERDWVLDGEERYLVRPSGSSPIPGT
jgi:hypothetical protein